MHKYSQEVTSRHLHLRALQTASCRAASIRIDRLLAVIFVIRLQEPLHQSNLLPFTAMWINVIIADNNSMRSRTIYWLVVNCFHLCIFDTADNNLCGIIAMEVGLWIAFIYVSLILLTTTIAKYCCKESTLWIAFIYVSLILLTTTGLRKPARFARLWIAFIYVSLILLTTTYWMDREEVDWLWIAFIYVSLILLTTTKIPER